MGGDQDQDNEYRAAGSLNEETRLLDPNNVHIKYIGGVLSTHDLPAFRRFIIRVTRCRVFVHAFDLHAHAEDQIIGDDYAKGAETTLTAAADAHSDAVTTEAASKKAQDDAVTDK